MKKELEMERKNEAENVPVDTPQLSRDVSLEASLHLAVTGVYFKYVSTTSTILVKVYSSALEKNHIHIIN